MATKKPAKSGVKKRTLNPPGGAKKLSRGQPFGDLDPQRRLGNFTTAGEHARVGGRTTGIVGQTKQKSSRDNKRKKK